MIATAEMFVARAIPGRPTLPHGSSTRALRCVGQVVEWARLNFELEEPVA